MAISSGSPTETYLALALANSKRRVADLERQLLDAGISPRPFGASPPVAIVDQLELELVIVARISYSNAGDALSPQMQRDHLLASPGWEIPSQSGIREFFDLDS